LEAHALRAADSFSQARDEFDRLERRLQSGETLRMSHSDLESFIEREGRELLRQLLQAHLDLRAGAKVAGPVVGADGVERTHHREGERKLETLLGGVTVNREGFGARGKPTLFPLDADLNLPDELFSFGTGVIEGACRHLVRDRMEITGARWSLEGAEAVLRLRSLRASGDLEDYWRYHERMERERNHQSLYAGSSVPEMTPPEPPGPPRTRGPLRVVK
jgi:hypothetical protein